MMKKCNFKTRRILLVVSFFVFLLSLTSCKTAGNLSGNLQVDDIYVKAGNYTVTKGELWNELKWSASTELTSKFNDVITKAVTRTTATASAVSYIRRCIIR